MQTSNENERAKNELGFDPLPIILGIAGLLLLVFVIICIYGIKKAMDIANQDKVIVF